MSTPSFPARMAVSAEELATRWSVTPEFIHELRKANKLPYIVDGRSWSFPIAACDRAMTRLATYAKSDATYQRNRKSGKRVGKGNA